MRIIYLFPRITTVERSDIYCDKKSPSKSRDWIASTYKPIYLSNQIGDVKTMSKKHIKSQQLNQDDDLTTGQLLREIKMIHLRLVSGQGL